MTKAERRKHEEKVRLAKSELARNASKGIKAFGDQRPSAFDIPPSANQSGEFPIVQIVATIDAVPYVFEFQVREIRRLYGKGM